jgi:hypothetical protein
VDVGQQLHRHALWPPVARPSLRYLKYVLKRSRPWGGVRPLAHLRHFAQSEHARRVPGWPWHRLAELSDPIPVYTAPEYVASLPPRLAGASAPTPILYNQPRDANHGSADVRLSAAASRPLRGLDREQLRRAFLDPSCTSTFGHHPGKDRLPREAALHGCCVITARGTDPRPIGGRADPGTLQSSRQPNRCSSSASSSGGGRAGRTSSIARGIRPLYGEVIARGRRSLDRRHRGLRAATVITAARCRTAPGPSRFRFAARSACR